MAENDLHVFLDTESLDNTYSQNKNKLDRLLLYHDKKPFIFERSPIKSDLDIIARVKESGHESHDIEIKTANLINNKLFKKLLTDGEREFLCLMVKYASTHKNFKNAYVDNAVYVTENHDFLRKFIGTNSELHLRAFFPTLRLVDLGRALETSLLNPLVITLVLKQEI